MTTFFLILILLDSLTFGGAPTPKLRKVRAPRTAIVTQTTPPNCTPDANGELTCYPVDQADKFKR
jgi:hypothetical protein